MILFSLVSDEDRPTDRQNGGKNDKKGKEEEKYPFLLRQIHVFREEKRKRKKNEEGKRHDDDQHSP